MLMLCLKRGDDWENINKTLFWDVNVNENLFTSLRKYVNVAAFWICLCLNLLFHQQFSPLALKQSQLFKWNGKRKYENKRNKTFSIKPSLTNNER